MKNNSLFKKYKKLIIMLAAMTFVIGAAFFVYLKSVPINSYTLPIMSAVPDVGRMEEDGYYFDSEHADQLIEEKQKVFLNIPTEVAKGSYTLRVGYRSGAGSNMSVASKTNPNAVKCDYVALTHLPEELPGEYLMNYGLDYLPGFTTSEIFITKDVSDLDVFVVYCGYQYFHIESVELIGNRNYIKTIFPVFMLIVLLADILIFGFVLVKSEGIDSECGRYLCSRYRNIGIVVLIGVLSSTPLLFNLGLQFDDGQFLYTKINGIMEGLRDGQFPVRIHPNTLQGYGYGVSYFYPELFLYPFGIMRMLGYSLRFTVYTLIVCINMATAAVAFISVKKIFYKDSLAAIGAFIYTFSLYRLLDIFARGAVAEALAMIFLPMFIWGIYEILVKNGSIAPLTVSLFGLMNSHILSCEMIAVFSIILCIPCYRLIFKKESLLKLIKSATLAVLLSVYFLFPFLHMSTTDNFKVYAQNAYDTSENMLSIGDLFALTSKGDGNSGTGSFMGVRYTLGIVIMIVMLTLFITMLIAIRKQVHADAIICKFVSLNFLFAVIAVILSSKVFPWKMIENVGGIVRSVFCMVQFPWRYLSIAMVCAMFSICGSIYIINEVFDGKMSKLKYSLGVAGILLAAQVILLFASFKTNASDEFKIYDGSYLRKHPGAGMGEYEPEGFDEEKLDISIEELQYHINPDAVINPSWMGGNGGLSIGPVAKSGTDLSIIAINQSDKEEILYLPLTWYKGYRISNIAEDPNGNNTVPRMFETEQGTIGVEVPVGYYNGIHVEYKEPFIYRIAELISFVTLLCLALFGVKSAVKTKKSTT